jgi:hypothetical protein
MKIEWVILAEGFGSASNGAVTAIGVNQNLIIAPSLPVTTKRGIMVHLVADDDSLADAELELAVSILNPSGKTLVAQASSMRTAVPQWPDLPVTFDIFAEFPLRLSEYGSYTIDISVSAPHGEQATGTTSLHVRPPQ